MTALLAWGASARDATLRHEIPVGIIDPLLIAIDGERTWIMSSQLEATRLAACRPDAELIDVERLGLRELLDSGRSHAELEVELAARLVAEIGLREALVESTFPLGIAERLRADGVTITVDDAAIKTRRRVKSEAELSGIRRAQRAAEAAMAAAAALLGRARAEDGWLFADGTALTAERVREAMRAVSWERGALLGAEAIVASVHQGSGHDPGSGPLPAGLPIQIDVWPQDELSACWADMTRTFVVAGDGGEEVARQTELVTAALEAATAGARPGVSGRELHIACCEHFEGAGYPTSRSAEDSGAEGFRFSLGHGVGLEVHEAPAIGMLGHQPLVPGDVIAVEPGLWRDQVGGVRFEDLLLITAEGCERLTDFPYDLDPAVGATVER